MEYLGIQKSLFCSHFLKITGKKKKKPNLFSHFLMSFTLFYCGNFSFLRNWHMFGFEFIILTHFPAFSIDEFKFYVFLFHCFGLSFFRPWQL